MVRLESFTTMEEFEKKVLHSALPVVLYFYSEDCPPCQTVTPLLDRTDESFGQYVSFVKILRQHNKELADKYNVKSSPTLLFFKDGKEVCSRLTGYISNPELRRSLEQLNGGTCPGRERTIVNCDVIILGAGAAGLAAAIYTARAKLFTVVLDESMAGGQVASTYHVANYPGTNGVIRGIDLMENMKRQVLDFGAQLDDMKEILEIKLKDAVKYVKADDTDYYAKAVIIATGAQPRKLPAEGESEYRGRGVHYCATCDGALYQDADVLVVGGGNSAVEEAVFLTRYARHVTIIHRSDRFTATKAAQDEVFRNPNISVLWDSEVKKVEGDNFVKKARVENLKTGEIQEIATDGLFIYIGTEPKTEFLKKELKLNENGSINTDEDMRTEIQGVYAVGDVREKKVRQIVTAASDGAIAGIMAERYINGRQDAPDEIRVH